MNDRHNELNRYFSCNYLNIFEYNIYIMKNLILSICVLSIGFLFLPSCSEEVNMIDGFSETPIIYGLLDQADSIHYIKINRAFIGPGNWLEIAKIPDSSYFDQVEAKVTEIGGLNRIWTLKDTIIQNKDENGAWYAPTQKVYYFETSTANPLNPTANYKLEVLINGGAIKVAGETKLVNGLGLNSATPSNSGFNFVKNPGEYENASVKLSSTGNALIVNAEMKIWYAEYTNSQIQEKSFVWKLGESDVNNDFIGFQAPGKTFYTLFRDNLVPNQDITKRVLRGIEITFVGGSEDLSNYIAVNKPASTLAQNKPMYTNLTVTGTERIIGIFSSRQTKRIFKPASITSQPYIRVINNKSTIELCQGPITGNLKFCSDHPGDIGESYSCQ
jgi:hypothetical protein